MESINNMDYYYWTITNLPENHPTVQPNLTPRETRFNYLYRVTQVLSMLEVVRPEHAVYFSLKPEEQLMRGFDILHNTCSRQMTATRLLPNVREGSGHNWFSRRLLPEMEADEVGPHDTVEADHDPQIETFNEPRVHTGSSSKPDVDEDLRLSRWVFLEGLRDVLYLAQENNVVPAEALKRAWLYLMDQCGICQYLKLWLHSHLIAAQWTSLSADEKQEFLKKFDLGPEVLESWIRQEESRVLLDTPEKRFGDAVIPFAKADEQAAAPGGYTRVRKIHWELAQINRVLREYMGRFLPEVLRKGFEDECSDIKKWSTEVVDRQQLRDKDCPICFTDYCLTAEDSDSKETVPALMRCGHIICISCFTTWVNGDTANHNKCTICRRKLPPPNPHIKYTNDMIAVMEKHQASKQPFGIQSSFDILKAVDLFLSRLPVDYRDTEPVGHDTNPANLTHWLNNMNRPHSELRAFLRNYRNTQVNKVLHIIAAKACLSCLHVARDRLRAYLTGDQQAYTKACKDLLLVRAHQMNYEYLSFARESAVLFEDLALQEDMEDPDFQGDAFDEMESEEDEELSDIGDEMDVNE